MFKVFLSVIKYVIIGFIIVLIIQQLSNDDTVQIFKTYTELRFTPGHYLLLTGILILMPINWLLEGRKWQILMSPHTDLKLKNAVRIVLAGIAAGIFTPGRIGEYAGRAVTSDSSKKIEVVSATLLGSIAQNLCNIAGGLLFSYYFLKNVFHVTNNYILPLILMVAVQICLLLLLYFRLSKVAAVLAEKSVFHRYKDKLYGLGIYTNRILFRVLFLSFVRYCIYTLQYVITMILLNVQLPITETLGNIMGIYLIQTGIPLPAIISIFARGEIAILVWGTVGVSSITALSATFLIWLINLILPAIAGLKVIAGTSFYRYFKKEEHE